MENFILIVHVLLAVGIVGLIMLQQGKGAEMGASFGSGSSQTVFGAVGTGNLFSRMTGILVAVFFVTSLALAVVAKKTSVIDVDDYLNDEPVAESVVSDDIDTADFDAALDEASDAVQGNITDALDDAELILDDAGSALEGAVGEMTDAATDVEKTLENTVKKLETEAQSQ